MKSTLMLYPQKDSKTLNFTLYETQSLQKAAGYIPQAKPAVISNCNEQIMVQHYSKLKLLRCLQSDNMHAKYFCIPVQSGNNSAAFSLGWCIKPSLSLSKPSDSLCQKSLPMMYCHSQEKFLAKSLLMPPMKKLLC